MTFAIKLERAYEHFKSLQENTGAWIDSKPHEIIDEPDQKAAQYAVSRRVPGIRLRQFRITHVEPVPGRLLAIIGDCVFNLRSAFDHLALALGKSFTPSMDERFSEFPVFCTAKEFKDGHARKVGCVSSAALQIIDALQPYHCGANYQTNPLWQINELNRLDKHRTCTTCILKPHGEIAMRIREGHNMSMVCHDLRPGEILANEVYFRYGGTVVGDEPEIGLEPLLSVSVTFGRETPLPLEPILPTLSRLCDYARDVVIAPLAKLL